jgi:hypothetical protein
MSCGNLILQDPIGRFWVTNAADDGVLLTVLSALVLTNYAAPVIQSPSFYWRLSTGLDGAVVATPVSPTGASASYLLTSFTSRLFTLTIGDDGVLVTTSAGLGSATSVPYPIDVSMSTWPPLGLTSSLSGATPLTVSADFSIWSCTLNRFINEDTTNIIVVLDE